mmetsp:Transcript_68955/g.202419  ORF Transcript_68955/g.202419 Transcript_68955/m.202419 type:complete len:844 (-) Transcript_68955:12-2543(-)
MPGRRLSCRHAGKQANKGKRRPPCALASSLLALGLLLLTRELVGEVLRERLLLLELHGEGGTALGERAQLTDVAEHGRERHRRRDDLQVALVVHVADLPTARVEIANDAAHVLLRRSDLDLHDRLQDHRVAVAGTLLEASAAGDLEGHHGGVHGVEGTVRQLHLDVNHGEPRDGAIQHLILHTLLNTRDVLLGDGSARDLVHELKALARVRLKAQLDLGVLAGAARLLLVRVPERSARSDRLTVRDLGRTHAGLHLELAPHAINDDLEVQLTHALDHGLVRLLVAAEAEGRVLCGQLRERLDHLVRVRLGRGLAGHLDHRLREVHPLQDDRGVEGAEGVAGGGVLEAHEGDDVAGAGLLDLLALVGVHQHHAAQALLLLGAGVQHHVAGLHLAGVDAEEGEGAHVGVRSDLEGKARELLLRVDLARKRHLLVLRVLARDRPHIDGRGQVVNHGVEQGLHALVLEGGATQHRHEAEIDRALADALLERRHVGLLARLQVLLQHLLILLHGRLHELGAVLRNQVLHALRDVIGDVKLRAHLRALPDDGLHVHEVVGALEGISGANGQLDGHRVAAELVHHHLHITIEVGTHAVHLVHKAHARHVVLVRLAPDGLALGLHARDTIEHRHGAIEHAERALHLQGEVHVTRRVHNVDAVAIPERGGGSARDGDAALALLIHPVHRGLALVDLTDLRLAASVVEDALRGRGLARVNVSHDSDVAVLIEGNGALLAAGLLQLVQRGHAHGNALARRPHLAPGRALRCAKRAKRSDHTARSKCSTWHSARGRGRSNLGKHRLGLDRKDHGGRGGLAAGGQEGGLHHCWVCGLRKDRGSSIRGPLSQKMKRP